LLKSVTNLSPIMTIITHLIQMAILLMLIMVKIKINLSTKIMTNIEIMEWVMEIQAIITPSIMLMKKANQKIIIRVLITAMIAILLTLMVYQKAIIIKTSLIHKIVLIIEANQIIL
jgi:hypothetical protein